MRLLRLEMPAFGPFTGMSIDLSGGTAGLHIIHGPNEAGKSASLRALKAALFGIDERTTDNFLHDNPKLRVGARLRRADGMELVFVRRKGRKNTLLAGDGETTLPDDELGRFLPGLNKELFGNLFAIDHAELLRGGREIAEGRGDLGESLFAAGMGTASLRAVMSTLAEEADKLFKPGGKVPLINASIRTYKDLRDQSKRGALSGRDWEDRQEELETLARQIERIAREAGDVDAELRRLTRLEQAIPLLVKRTEAQNALAAMGHVVTLRQAFQQDRVHLSEQLQKARRRHERAATDLAGVRETIEGLSVPEVLLQQAEPIGLLNQRTGAHGKSIRDLPKLERDQRRLRAEAQTILAELAPDTAIVNAAATCPTAAQKAGIRDLGEEFQTLRGKAETAAEKLSDLQETAAAATEELNALPATRDDANLRTAIRQARKAGDLEADLRTIHGNIADDTARVAIDIAALGLWTGEPSELERTPTPSRETIDRFDAAFAASAAELARIVERIDDAKDQAEKADGEILALASGKAIPTEQQLIDARTHRDAGWKLVREALAGRPDPDALSTFDPAAADLPSAYEQSVRHADDLADQLRLDSQRVADLAGLTTKRDQCRERLREQQDLQRDAARERNALAADWAAAWAPTRVLPLPPREMAAWLGKRDDLVGRIESVRDAQAQADRLAERIESLTDGLRQCVAAPADELTDKSLTECLECREGLLAELEAAEGRRDELERTLRGADRKLRTAEKSARAATGSIADWQERWTEAITLIGLDQATRPAETNAMLEQFGELADRLKQADRLQDRIDGIQSDAAAYAADVAKLSETVAPELATLAPTDAADRMHQRLRQAQTDAAALEQLLQQETSHAEAAATGTGDIAEFTGRLDDLCAEAKCDDVEQLPELEQRSFEAIEQQDRIDAVESELAGYCAGASVAALSDEAATVDADSLPDQIEQRRRHAAELDAHRQQLAEQKGRVQQLIDQMDGSAAAAELAEQAQNEAAGVISAARRYACLRLAGVILRQEIERYREANQGPILRRASAIFADLTVGSFARLRSDFDNVDNPILQGERPSGQAVGVEAMSEGTRDQLYLSLRLACLEKNLTDQEPVPFIIDDILINFDDQRSAATLKVLAELSRTTQVVFFTHHRHLVDLAHDVVGDDVLQVQSLGGT